MRNFMDSNLKALVDQLSILGLKLSKRKAAHIQYLLSNYEAHRNPLAVHELIDKNLNELKERIEHELEDKFNSLLSLIGHI